MFLCNSVTSRLSQASAVTLSVSGCESPRRPAARAPSWLSAGAFPAATGSAGTQSASWAVAGHSSPRYFNTARKVSVDFQTRLSLLSSPVSLCVSAAHLCVLFLSQSSPQLMAVSVWLEHRLNCCNRPSATAVAYIQQIHLSLIYSWEWEVQADGVALWLLMGPGSFHLAVCPLSPEWCCRQQHCSWWLTCLWASLWEKGSIIQSRANLFLLGNRNYMVTSGHILLVRTCHA